MKSCCFASVAGVDPEGERADRCCKQVNVGLVVPPFYPTSLGAGHKAKAASVNKDEKTSHVGTN